jgi:hypothetical protein
MVEERGKWKKYKEKNSRVRRRRGGAWYQSARTKSNGSYLAVLTAGVELLAVESKGDAGGVSGLDDDFLPAADGALAAGFQKLGRG